MADFEKLEELGLSKEAMDALREHLEQHESTGDTVEEDWHLSQFWYDDNTREKVAKEAHDHANGGNIAIISAPSIYQSYIKMYSENSNVYLFEFDERFQMYGENFVFYDFNHPKEIPEALHNKFTYIIIDPPYLTEDCFEGFVETIKLLSKYKAENKILCRLCVLTGAVQEEVVFKYLQCKPTTFTPTFANKLANEFYCYVNYKSDLGDYLPDVQ